MNPGISIKLSALHPRYEVAHEGRVLAELVPVVLSLGAAGQIPRAAGMGMNIDAEEQDRLVAVDEGDRGGLSGPVAGRMGRVRRRGAGLRQARRHGHRLALRAGHAAGPQDHGASGQGRLLGQRDQTRPGRGLPGFPLFTSKVATDVSYIANARKLIGYADRIYPQFATHNAQTVAAVLEMVGDTPLNSSACTAWASVCTTSC